MPRRRIFDVLQNHRFWAFDATGDVVSPVFTPLFGFSGITSPEINVEIETFRDGTYLYPRHIVKGGSISPISLERAATMFDSDFYSWVIHAIHGTDEYHIGENLASMARDGGSFATFRRNIVVVQHSGYSADSLDLRAAIGPAVFSGIAASGIGVTAGIGISAGSGVASAGGLGPFQFANKIPARAWLLHGCIPVSYRAGSDFDANSADPSIQELEIQPEYIEEFSLGIKP